MTTVAVTGVSGYLGQLVLRALETREEVRRVVGVDVKPPPAPGPKLEFYELDVRSPDLGEVVSGASALVHLATTSLGTADEVRDLNLGGARSVAEAASRARVGKVVLASTYRVYGAHADNDFPLTERSPLRPADNDAYARSMIEAESALEFLGDTRTQTRVTILRLAELCGAGLPTPRAGWVDAAFRPVLDGYRPPFQVLGERDAARAVAHGVANDLPGIFNISAGDWVVAPEEILGQRLLRAGTQRASRTLGVLQRLKVPVPPEGAGALMYPQVMSNETFCATEFSFTQTTAEALRETAEARRGWTALGPLHFRPRRAAMVAGTLGAVAAASAVRRGRRRSSDG